MRTSSHRRFAALIVATTGLVGSACSSSKAIKLPGDAAVTPDLVGKDLPGSDSGPDTVALGPDLAAPGPDTAVPGPDTAAPGSDTADLRRADQSFSDITSTDRDTSGADLAVVKDGILADLPDSPADGPATDGLRQDVPLADLPRADTARDLGTVCTPGAPQTCNDDPSISSIWGFCTADGTCVCNVGFAVNPETGRCMIAPKSDASTGDDTGQVCPGEFNACGCRCCGSTPRDMMCYYPTAGETLDPIKAKDEEARSGVDCTTAGCSSGIRYVCCVPAAAEPASGASYTADGWIGGADHLSISKSGADCADLTFSSGSNPRTGFHFETPEGWMFVGASFGTCADGGALEQAKGALGTLAFRASGDRCFADVHATLYAFTAAGEIKTSRLDADGIALDGMADMFCR